MEIIRHAADPWGQPVWLGASWDLIAVFAAAGVALIVVHLLFMWFWAPRLDRRRQARRREQ